MGIISKKALQDEAMELALFLYDVYTETQISQGETGQIDANTSNDTN